MFTIRNHCIHLLIYTRLGDGTRIWGWWLNSHKIEARLAAHSKMSCVKQSVPEGGHSLAQDLAQAGTGLEVEGGMGDSWMVRKMAFLS